MVTSELTSLIKILNEPPHDKTNNVVVRPAKTHISLGTRPVWSVFAVRMKKAWVLSYPLSASKDSDKTGRLPRLIWVFAGRTLTLLVLSRGGSNVVCGVLIWNLTKLTTPSQLYKEINRRKMLRFLKSISISYTRRIQECLYIATKPWTGNEQTLIQSNFKSRL